MKTPIVRTWEMALGSQVFDEVSRKFGPEAPTVAGMVIASGEITAESRTRKPVLPLGCSFQPIPSGKRLVIQEFDAAGTLEAGLKPEFIGLIPSDIAHWFTATFMASSNGFDSFATHQETRLYTPSSGAPYCIVGVSANSNGSYECSLSGFLVDVPAGGSGAVAPGTRGQRPTLPNGRHLGRQPNNPGR